MKSLNFFFLISKLYKKKLKEKRMWGGQQDNNNMDTASTDNTSFTSSSKLEKSMMIEDIHSIETNFSTENTGETFRDWKNPPGLLEGIQLNEKEIVWKKSISRGCFSEVWKASYQPKNDESSHSVCIKKMIRNQEIKNGDFPIDVLFAREVAYLKYLSSANHPNIIKFLGAYQSPEHCFIMTEFIKSDTIYKILHQDGKHSLIKTIFELLLPFFKPNRSQIEYKTNN